MNELTLEEEQAIKERCKESNRGEWKGGLTIYSCPVCTRKFVVHDERSWVYKRKKFINKRGSMLFYFCSYGCTRVFDWLFEKPKKMQKPLP